VEIFAGPRPILELANGTLFLVIIIFLHGTGLRIISKRYTKLWAGVTSKTAIWKINVILAIVISGLTALHLVETLLWALPIYLLGAIPALRDAYFFVLESYTTLGAGNVTLPDDWRLIGPVIAMSGLFTFGWTGSVLVGIMTEFGRLDHERARDPDNAQHKG